jgi:hypothetical protein
MQSLRSSDSYLVAARRLFKVSLATLPLAGCACEDLNWEAIIATVAEAAAFDAPTNCNADGLARLSKASAALAERADPYLLDIARLEAERDCYKAAEVRARQHLQALRRSELPLK